MTSNKYYEYLDSEQWRQKRNRILARDNYRCQKCGSAINLRVHHIRYPQEIGTEQDDDLITLCDSCHTYVHTTDIRRRHNANRQREIREQNKRLWVNYVKVRDFIYGGSENLCSLNLLKRYAANFKMLYGIEASDYMNIQYSLGYAHSLLVVKMIEKGYTQNDIYLMTPLDRNTIKKYTESFREERLNTIIPREEMNNAVDAYIKELEKEDE